jgi:hypothetical protein
MGATVAAHPALEPAVEALAAAALQRTPLLRQALGDGPALTRRWVAASAPDASVAGVQVGSVLYRPDGSATLRYEVRLCGARPRTRTLLVTVPRSGSDVVVRPFPADPGLPTLARAVDPALMRALLSRVVPGTGRDRAVARCTVDVVHYPRSDRCVLRYTLLPGAAGVGEVRHPTVFGKVYAGGSAAAAAATALHVLRGGTRDRAGGGQLVVPQPLAVVPSLRLGLATAVPGRPLLPRLLRSAVEAGSAAPGAGPWTLAGSVEAAGRVLAAVHRCAVPGSRLLPVRDLDGERERAAAQLRALGTVWPEAAGALHRRLGVALAGDLSGCHLHPPAGTGLVTAHGDFTPGQLLLGDRAEVALVDVDTLCRADPAMDLGRFLAYLHVAALRRAAGSWPLLERLTGVFLGAYLDAVEAGPDEEGAAAAAPGARAALLARTAAFRALALTGLGASACWQLKDRRLGAVLDVLDVGQDWMRRVAG